MPRINALKHRYIGKIVKHWMIDADLTAKELAEGMGITRSDLYYKIAHNSFSFNDLLNIIEICNVSDDEIVRTMRR